MVAARVAGLDDVYLIAADDAAQVPVRLAAWRPDGAAGPVAQGGVGRAEQQLAVLAVRLEMAAVYLRLVRG